MEFTAGAHSARGIQPSEVLEIAAIASFIALYAARWRFRGESILRTAASVVDPWFARVQRDWAETAAIVSFYGMQEEMIASWGPAAKRHLDSSEEIHEKAISMLVWAGADERAYVRHAWHQRKEGELTGATLTVCSIFDRTGKNRDVRLA